MATFTITDFRKKYDTDAKCLDRIFVLRYGKLEACPECACPANFRRITTRRCYQCAECYSQFYPTAGTVFEKTRTPLADWFYVIYLFTSTRNGVAAKEIQRQLGVTYKCAFRMGHKIRELIQGVGIDALKGIVECDEARVGGKNTNRHFHKKVSHSDAIASNDKTIVFGAVERGGRIVTKVIPDVSSETLVNTVKNVIAEGSIVFTDEWRGYNKITQHNYFHGKVHHASGEYARGVIHTNSIEGFWTQLKRTVVGTHVSVSPHYLQAYSNECAFRYNNRHNQVGMFDAIIGHLPVVTQ